MKNIILFCFFLIFSISISSQVYRKMVDSRNKWNYLYEEPVLLSGGAGYTETLSFSISVDTIIEGTSYKKVKCVRIKYNGTDTSYAGAIREDSINQKVFVRLPGMEEKLMYAFNVKVDDLISTDTTSFKDYALNRTVKSIGQYDFNGFGGKKITVVDSMIQLKLPFKTSESRRVYFYEGIGSLRTIFDLYYFNYPTFTISEFLCFSHNDSLIVSNPKRNACIYTNFPDEIEQTNYGSGLYIYPNPIDCKLTIESNIEIKRIEIYDLSGQLILKSPFLILDLSNVETGVYILKIIYKNGQQTSHKITKK